MLILLLAYLGGILTIVSPCILPVLPFVFARADRSFLKSTLPLLAGMAATFAIVATLAAVGGGWAVRANAIGRAAALILLALFGLALVFPSVSDRLTRPLVAMGSRLTEREGQGESVWSSLVLGVATGLLWAPCAGPILGIIFTAAAFQGASFNTTLLLLAYALGAATSLALALLVGGRVFARMKKSLGASERIRQVLGILVLAGVAAIALGLDTRVLAKLSSAQTVGLESGLARKLGLSHDMGESRTRTNAMGQLVLPVEGQLPPLDGLVPWLNTPPLSLEQLRGKVVVIDFWTYSCINCIRSIPFVKAWWRSIATTAWSSSAFTRPSSRSSASRPTSRAQSRTSASPTRSRSTMATSCGARSRTITGPRTTSSMRRAASATTISAKAMSPCRSG